MLKTLFGAIGAFALLTVGAFAGDQPLTEDQAQRFVKTLPVLESFGKELEAEGKMEEFRISTEPMVDKEFKPYSSAITVLKEEHPADHARLGAKLKPHGFSADEWAGVGDRVIIAWMALKMEQEDPGAMAQMEAMDQSMIEMMPENMKAQIQRALVMVETVKSASPEDKAVVATVKDDLDAYMQSQSQQ